MRPSWVPRDQARLLIEDAQVSIPLEEQFVAIYEQLTDMGEDLAQHLPSRNTRSSNQGLLTTYIPAIAHSPGYMIHHSSGKKPQPLTRDTDQGPVEGASSTKGRKLEFEGHHKMYAGVTTMHLEIPIPSNLGLRGKLKSLGRAKIIQLLSIHLYFKIHHLGDLFEKGQCRPIDWSCKCKEVFLSTFQIFKTDLKIIIGDLHPGHLLHSWKFGYTFHKMFQDGNILLTL